jgi:hypothetical protein
MSAAFEEFPEIPKKNSVINRRGLKEGGKITLLNI